MIYDYGHSLASENQLRSVSSGGTRTLLDCDADNRLRSIGRGGVITNCLYHGDDLVAEYDSDFDSADSIIGGGIGAVGK